jgi:hypothetical protein
MMLVVDIFSKMVDFIPCKKTNDTAKVVVLFFREIVILHRLPRSITFDRDTMFIEHFWRILWKNMGSKLLYNFTYHPQIDGQTEVVNQSLGNTLRILSGRSQDNGILSWDMLNLLIMIMLTNF